MIRVKYIQSIYLGVVVVLEALYDAPQPGVDLLHQELCGQVVDLGEGGDGDGARLLQLLIHLNNQSEVLAILTDEN